VNGRRILLAVMLLTAADTNLLAWEWITIVPNPAYSRDLAMGASTLALSYPPQSQSINPAGYIAFGAKSSRMAAVILNPGGLWQVRNYFAFETSHRTGIDQVWEPAELLVNSISVRWRIATLAGIFGQPVMLAGDPGQYDGFSSSSSLESHQNSVLLGLNLHPRVSVAGRIDRYYHFSTSQGEGYSYGVILRPRGLELGVQYQRYPASGAHVWHPLDRRHDQSVTAGIALDRQPWKVTAQVLNLTALSDSLRLEPHVGAEWRPWQHLGLRAGLLSFSDGKHWAWTSGFSVFDANALRDKHERLPVPDDVLQAAVGVQYNRGKPELGIASLTLSWRW
jgi:hypothetical protein